MDQPYKITFKNKFLMKSFIAGLFAFVTELVMAIPIWIIRRIYLTLFIGGMGKGCFIMRNVDIRKPRNIKLGKNVVVNKRTMLDGRGGLLLVGDNTDIAQEVNIWTLTHDINDPNHCTVGKSVRIEEYCWIGARATILPGITIGKGAVVGTCAVVTKDVPPMTVVAGNPAKIIGIRNNPLTFKLDFHPWFL